MSIGLIKEEIVLNQHMGKEYTQILLEGDIIVPDVKPDMSVLLKTGADAVIDKVEISAGRVNFFGKLNIAVLYLAKDSEKSIHSINASAPIEDFLNIDGIDKDMWATLSSTISNIDYRMINDRKIGYRAVIDLEIKVESRLARDVVTDVRDLAGAQIKKAALSVNKTVDKRDDSFIIKDELPIPPGKPNIRELLQTSIDIANKEIKVSSGRVSISGELIVSTLYRGDDEESVFEFVENEVPFNGSIDVPGARDGMTADVALKISDQYVQVKPDEDGEDRVLDMEVSIACVVKVMNQEDCEILEDAYCINKKLELKRESVTYPHLICRNKNQFPVKEVVQLEVDAPGMLQILRACGDVKLDDVSVTDDRVTVEGIANVEILYIANSDETPLYNYKAVLPYKQVIETKGALPTMLAEVEPGVDHIGFNMLSENEVEIRCLLNFGTKVIENIESGVVTDIEVYDLDREIVDAMASITIYAVQRDDSLWKIAKRYNTTVEDIVALNDIDNPDMIYPGQKLLVLKKSYES